MHQNWNGLSQLKQSVAHIELSEEVIKTKIVVIFKINNESTNNKDFVDASDNFNIPVESDSEVLIGQWVP